MAVDGLGRPEYMNDGWWNGEDYIRRAETAQLESIIDELTAWQGGDAHTLARWLYAKGVRPAAD